MPTALLKIETMICHKSVRVTALIMGAVGALSFPLSAQTEDPQATIAALKAQLAARDAEIAALKGTAPKLAAPAQMTEAVPAANTTATVASPMPVSHTTTAAKDEKGDEVLRMSAFEVRTTAGLGYSAGNSASALKTSESLMNLPAQIIVLTSDMVKDIGSHHTTDILAYAGLVAFYRGPAIMSRGSRVGNAYLDDVPQATGIGVSDNTNIDTYQVIKGPQQAMYPLASLGGLVIQSSKKPLPGLKQYIFDLRVQQWGRQTFTFDLNQPIGNVGDAKVTARIEGIAQQGQGPFYNSKDDRKGIFPNVTVDWRDTTLLFQYDAQQFHYLPGGTGILTPDGGIYTGLGHRNQNTPPNDFDTNTQHDARLVWTQRLSPDWQVKSQLVYFNVRRFGSAGFPTTVNWNNNTMTYTIRKDDGYNAVFNAQTDVSGKYKLGSMSATTAAGFNLQDQMSYSKFLTTVPTVTIPIGNAAAINSITFPDPAAYPIPANPGSRTEQYVSSGYFMETLEVIKDRLTLVGGLTFTKIETVQDTNIALKNPFTATDAPGHAALHRLAAIFHVTKDLTVYATESTTFNPAVGVTFNNTPLPPVKGKSDEVGFKTAFNEGKISFSAAIYKMELTNQAILAQFPALNIAGLNYFIPIGSTTSKGWDASFALMPVSGWQIVGTGYQGTVHDQNNNTITGTVENSWSLFTRYDFNPADRSNPFHGLGFGGGAQRAGGKWFTRGGLILPDGTVAANVKDSSGQAVQFKLKQGVLVNLFAEYQINRNWSARIDCANVLDKKYAIGAQGVGLADAVDPRTFSFTARLKL